MAALDTEHAATPKRFAPALRAGFRAAVALLYPPSCIGCGGATGVAHALCARCWAQVRFIERPYCERLGTPLPVDLGVTLLSPPA
jgi:predicted amidophosphoribosyltransferase